MPGRRAMRERPCLAGLVDDSGADTTPVPLADRLGRVARAGWPWAGSEHGRLPVLLVGLTVVTGLVDAVSYVALGHVFVANMTGNVVFLGFALAGAPGLSAPASLAALGAFLIGDGESPRRRVLNPHRDRQRHDEAIAGVLGNWLAERRGEDRRE